MVMYAMYLNLPAKTSGKQAEQKSAIFALLWLAIHPEPVIEIINLEFSDQPDGHSS